MTPENPITIISIIAALAALLGYVIKHVLTWLFAKVDSKDKHIIKITEQFTETINHKTTQNTQAVKDLSKSIEAQTGVFTALFEHLTKK